MRNQLIRNLSLIVPRWQGKLRDAYAIAKDFTALSSATPKHIEIIAEACRVTPPARLKALQQHDLKIHPLLPGEMYRSASAEVRRIHYSRQDRDGVVREVDDLKYRRVHGLYVPQEKTIYLECTSVSTITHELGHAYDHYLGFKNYGKDVFASSLDPALAVCWQTYQQSGIVFSGYSTTNIAEFFADGCKHFSSVDGAKLQSISPLLFHYIKWSDIDLEKQIGIFYGNAIVQYQPQSSFANPQFVRNTGTQESIFGGNNPQCKTMIIVPQVIHGPGGPQSASAPISPVFLSSLEQDQRNENDVVRPIESPVPLRSDSWTDEEWRAWRSHSDVLMMASDRMFALASDEERRELGGMREEPIPEGELLGVVTGMNDEFVAIQTGETTVSVLKRSILEREVHMDEYVEIILHDGREVPQPAGRASVAREAREELATRADVAFPEVHEKTLPDDGFICGEIVGLGKNYVAVATKDKGFAMIEREKFPEGHLQLGDHVKVHTLGGEVERAGLIVNPRQAVTDYPHSVEAKEDATRYFNDRAKLVIETSELLRKDVPDNLLRRTGMPREEKPPENGRLLGQVVGMEGDFIAIKTADTTMVLLERSMLEREVRQNQHVDITFRNGREAVPELERGGVAREAREFLATRAGAPLHTVRENELADHAMILGEVIAQGNDYIAIEDGKKGFVIIERGDFQGAELRRGDHVQVIASGGNVTQAVRLFGKAEIDEARIGKVFEAEMDVSKDTARTDMSAEPSPQNVETNAVVFSAAVESTIIPPQVEDRSMGAFLQQLQNIKRNMEKGTAPGNDPMMGDPSFERDERSVDLEKD